MSNLHSNALRTYKESPQLSIFENTESHNLSSLKNKFLKSLKSPSNPDGFKRYKGVPLRYAGGKSLAVGYLVERIPGNINRIISPFLGGASFEIACAKELNLPVIGFDIFDILINYWQHQISKPNELYQGLIALEPNRETFKIVKDRLNTHWRTDQKIDSDLELAIHYYFNHNTSYGPHFLGWPSDVYLDRKRYLVQLEKVRNFNVPNLQAECASFEDVIRDHPNDFLYCDPPYFLDGDSKTFVGLYPHRNFPIHHKGFRHDLLRDLLHNHKGGFLLSYNDCSTIREWYKDFEFSTPSWQYTFSQGDTRIGANRARDNNGSHIKKSHEILIWKTPR